MVEIADQVLNYGVSAVIITLFLWDWIANKKIITETLKQIAKCLEEMKINNSNTYKSLEILQKSMDNQDKKLDKIIGGEK